MRNVFFTLIALFLQLSLFAGTTYIDGVGTVDSGGGSCTDLSQTSSNDYWSIASATHASQKIKYESGCTLGSATVELYRATSDVGVHLEVWDHEDRSDVGASQIGGDSDTQTVSATAAGTFYTFTWASNKPTPTADYFLHVIYESGSGTLYRRTHTDETLYEDTDYDIWYGSDGDVNEQGSNSDMSFTVNYD